LPEHGFFRILYLHVRSGRLRAAGTEMLIAAVVLLAAGILLLGANVSALRDNGDLVQRIDSALLQIAEVDNKTIGVEFAMRGFGLTGDPYYLRGYFGNREYLHVALDKLAATVADQPADAPRLAKLRALLETRVATFEKLAALGPGHAREIAAVIVTPEVRDNRNEALGMLYGIRDDELKLLAERQQSSAHDARQTYILAAGIIALAFLLSVAGLMLSRGNPEHGA
jgi:CHASE3 domain sensor protein